jgi:hypothetical protein
MEELNYHKLLNLQKKIYKYAPSESAFIVAEAIEKAIAIEKKKSEEADKERRLAYQLENVECPFCGKELRRKSLYYHKNICKLRPIENPSTTP